MSYDWIINNQLGRRNLSPEQASYLRGKRYNLEKTAGHGAKSAHHSEGQHTAEKLAAEYKVSRATIERDGQFAEAVDTLAQNVGHAVKQQILTRDAPLTKEATVHLAKAPVETQRAVVEKLKELQAAYEQALAHIQRQSAVAA